MRPNVRDIGDFQTAYVGYSSDARVRSGAASGGVVSQILIDLLSNGIIDQAVVSRIDADSGKLGAKLVFTSDRDQILSARTSIYFDYDLLGPLIEQLDPSLKYGIVMLPCQARAFTKLCANKKWERSNFIIIGLFCGHATDRELLEQYFIKKRIDQEEIESFSFRVGHWRGKSIIKMRGGQELIYPTMHYNLYQNLFFYMKTRCLSCEDHFARYADISCGDAWLRSLKSKLIKHSMLIVRNDNLVDFIQCASDKTLALSSIPASDLLKSQKRSVIFHSYNIHGRSLWAPLFNLKISSKSPQKPRWNDIVGAFFILANYRVSRSSIGTKLIMSLPPPLLFAYAMFMKFFINF